jgi:hypothetical protein
MTKSILGPKHCSHQDWFDKNNSAIEGLLKKKNGGNGKMLLNLLQRRQLQVTSSQRAARDQEDAGSVVGEKGR